MKFNLKIRMPDDSIDIWKYDTFDNEIASDTYGVINSNKTISDDDRNLTYSGTDEIIKDYSNIRNLIINPGLKCNLNCKYCPQNDIRDSIHSACPDDVDGFISRLEKAKNNGLDKLNMIQIWGGEPLVYWKTLIKLIPKLHELYPDPCYTIITNGILLDKEKIDFLYKYGFTLTVSHDGYDSNRYRESENILAGDKLELMRYAANLFQDKFYISIVLTADHNINIINKYNYFKDHLKNDKFKMILCALKWSDVNKDNIRETTQEERDILTNSLYEVYRSNIDNIYLGRLNYEEFKDRVIGRLPIDRVYSLCKIVNDGLVVDLAGNTYNCHIKAQRTGILENINILPSTNNISWKYRKHCPECPLVQVCGGYCLRQSNEYHELTCKNSVYPIYLATFKAVFKDLFNVEVLEIQK